MNLARECMHGGIALIGHRDNLQALARSAGRKRDKVSEVHEPSENRYPIEQAAPLPGVEGPFLQEFEVGPPEKITDSVVITDAVGP